MNAIGQAAGQSHSAWLSSLSLQPLVLGFLLGA